eukprot:COSAG01_NODE_34884_length_540_cov_1.621315_1_plen_64_part_10
MGDRRCLFHSVNRFHIQSLNSGLHDCCLAALPHESVRHAGVECGTTLWDCLSFNSQPPPRGTPI